MAISRGPKLLQSVPFTLYGCFIINWGLGFNLSKHAFNMQKITAHVLNKDTAWLLLTLTGKLAAYLLLLSLTSIILCSLDSHLECEAEFAVLSELSISVLSGVSSILVGVCLGVQCDSGACIYICQSEICLGFFFFDNGHWY